MVGRDELGHRSETVRRANLSAIVRELHGSGPSSRSDLVAHTGLTRSAIRALIGELVAGGLVTEERAALDGTPGRPSPLVRPNPHGAVVLGLEIAVDQLSAATVGLGGEVFDTVRMDVRRGRTSVDDIATDLAELAATLRDRLPAQDTLIGIGVAVVGIVRRSDGLVFMAPNLGWRDEPLGKRLAVAMRTTIPIALANESDLAVIAEYRRGAARDVKNVVLLWGSVGVGGGVIIDGAPLTGIAGYGGEIGHMPVNPDGLPCRCGSIGCWESEVGGAALLRRAGYSPEGGAEAMAAVMRDAAGRFARRPGRPGRDRSVAGDRHRRPHQHPESRADPRRRPARPVLPVRPVHARGRARSARAPRLAPGRPRDAGAPRHGRPVARGG